MQHSPGLKTEAGAAPNDAAAGDRDSPVFVKDRSMPAWAQVFSYIFSIGHGACLIALAVMAVFFQSIVGMRGETIMAPLLGAIGLVPVLGVLVCDAAQAKALAGHRAMRRKTELRARAATGVLAVVVLAMVHPLLGLAPALGMGIAWVTCALAGRFAPKEPMWDFLPQEAVSIVSGRDDAGLRLAQAGAGHPVILDTGLKVAVLLAFLAAFSVSGWLTAQGVFNVSAMASIALISIWSVHAAGQFFRLQSQADPDTARQARSVQALDELDEFLEPEAARDGFSVRNLNVHTAQAQGLLADVSFDLQPGKILGLRGGNFAGKSLLMKALISPQDMAGLSISGFVSLYGINLWHRSTTERGVPAMLLPARPVLLPTSGSNNLACFEQGPSLDRARDILKQLVFTADTVQHICDAKNAYALSTSEQKALAFARALFLRPRLFLIDRPEDGASVPLLGALADRMQQECRLGASFIVATENRAILEICDTFLMLQNGRVVDFGPAEEIRARMSAGWIRFVADRVLDSEESLDSWLCAQFRRDGDETNRRNVCMVANEMLAFSCQDVQGLGQTQTLRFEFKHFKGHCVLRMIDGGPPVSTGALQKAEKEAASADDVVGRLTPLAAITRDSQSIDVRLEGGQRAIEVEIATYDPRLTGAEQETPHGVAVG